MMIKSTRFLLIVLTLLCSVCAIAQVNFPIPQHRSQNPATGEFKMHGVIGHPHEAPKAVMVASLPIEKVKSECLFFGGDTLTEYNFDVASKQAEIEGNKMYVEFRSFMFKNQVEFVKKKYHLKSLPFESAMANRQAQPNVPAASACNNLDFENGNATGWTTYSGYNTNSNGALTTVTTPATQNLNQSIYTCDFFNLTTSAYGNDPVGAFPGLDPNGGNYSCRVGDFSLNFANGYSGTCSGDYYSATYSNGEEMSQTIVVSAANALLSYDYAVILNDGGHPNGQQPYFHVRVTNTSGTVLSACTEYYVQAPAGSPPPGFTNSGYVNSNDNSILYYQSWRSGSINLTPYLTQTVKITFTAAGCTNGGHTAWAYVDATCGAAQIIAGNTTPCSGTTTTLTAPSVFGGTYAWSGPGIVGSTTGQSITVNATGTYSVVVTPAQGVACQYTLSQAITFVTSPTLAPTATPATLCSGNSTTLNANATNATSYSWNPGGATTSTVSVSPGVGTTVYTVTSTNAGVCPVSKTVTVTVTATPTVNITGTKSICSGASTTLTGATATNYSWSVGSTSNAISVNPTTTTTYTLVGSNGTCSTTAVATVTVTPTPTLTISGTTALCSGQSTMLTGATATNYTWSTGPNTNTISVTPPTGTTTYTLTGANGACISTKTVSVVVTATPTLTISGVTALCSGQSTTLTGATATNYTWSTGPNTNTLSVTPPTGTTTYTLTGANGTCISTKTVSVVVTATPTMSISGTTALCSGQSTTLTGATATNYTWSANAGSATTNTVSVTPPTGSTTYTLTGANGTCTATALATVVVTATPTLTISGVTALCSGQSTTLTGATATNYTWSSGPNTNTISVTPATGTTTYTLTGANGTCVSTKTVSVNVTATPTVNITGASPICSGQSVVLNGATATNYTWSPGGATTSTVSVNPGATTTYTLTGANGTCTATALATVTVTPTPTVNISGATGICSGQNLVLTGATATNYTWSPGSVNTNTISISPATTTTYTLVGANGTCTTSATSVVTVTTTPTISITGAGGICSGQNITLNGGTATNYTWSPSGGNSNSATVSPATNTTYTLTGANGTCTSSAVAVVTVTATPTMNITGSTPICNGQNLVLTGGTASTYSWSSGGITSNTITVNPTTNTTYTLTGYNGTCTATAVATVTVNPLPVIGTASITAAPCGQSTGCINNVVVTGGTPVYQYSWNGGPLTGSSTFCNQPAGTDVLVVQDANGCTSTQNFSIPSQNGPSAPQAAATATTTCLGDTVVLSITNPVAGIVYTWTDNTGTHTGTTYTVNNINPPGNYNVSVTATDVNGCVSSASTLSITVNSLPPTTVSGTANFCKGASTVLNASPSGSGFSYQWSLNGNAIVGATAASYTANASGNYGVIITDNTTGCKAASAGNYTVTVDSLPKIDTSSMVITTSNCNQSTGSVLSVSVTPNAANNIYSWTNQSNVVVGTTINLGNVPAGTYCLLVTDSNNCKSTVCGVTINNTGAPPAPTLNTPNNTYCQGQTIAPVVVSGSGTFTWYSDAGLTTQIANGTTYTPTVVTTTTLYVTATNSGCQSVSTPVVITINTTPPTPIVITPTFTYCQSQTVGTLSASGTGTLIWSTSASMNPIVNTGSTYTPTGLPIGTTTYYLQDTSAAGCRSVSTATISVTINQTPLDPTVTASSYTYCQGQAISPITANGSGTILWYDNSGLTPVINTGATYTPPGTLGTNVYYIVDSLSNGGCKSTGTVTVSVTVNQTPTNPIISASSYTACQGQTVGPITATGSGTIVWSTSPTMSPIVHTGNTYSPTGLPVSPPPVVYYIQDTSAAGCKSATAAATVTVTINPNPTISGIPLTDTSKCGQNNGAILNLTASGGTPGYTYQWINGSGATVGDSANLHNVGAGTYSLIVTDANQCKDTSNTGYNVVATNAISANFTPSVLSGQAPLNVVFTNTSVGASTYTWTLGDGTGSLQTNPAYTYTTNGSYTVTLISANGNCVATATTVIVVDVATSIIIPNIFSPNGDGVNDDFIIICSGMKTLTCDIFNRWGQLVYTLTGPDQSWDGRLNNGNMASEGTYFYILSAVGLDGKTYSYQGPLTLVK